MSLAPWLQPVLAALCARLDSARLPHALLITGDADLGGADLAEALVAAALCRSRATGGVACGSCRSCLLLAAGSHPDRVRVALEAEAKQIKVDQIRAVSSRLGLSSQQGAGQYVIIEPAELMNTEAANALLKTLEEPSPGNVLILVSAQSWRLPATVRSRCQIVALAPPPSADALAFLVAQGIDPQLAPDLLVAAGGVPSRALALAEPDSLALRKRVSSDLDDLSARRSEPAVVAARWCQQGLDAHLTSMSLVLHQRTRAASRSQDGLTGSLQTQKLLAVFDTVLKAGEALRTTLRPDLIANEVLVAWIRTATQHRR